MRSFPALEALVFLKTEVSGETLLTFNKQWWWDQNYPMYKNGLTAYYINSHVEQKVVYISYAFAS